MPTDNGAVEMRSNTVSHLWLFLIKCAESGTEKYDEATKRRLTLINVAAYLIALASLNYVILYAYTDYEKYWLLVLANLFLMSIALLVPQAHRINDVLGAIIIACAEYAMLFYLVSQLGRDSGIHLNYIIGAAAAFLIFDHSRFGLIATLVLGGLALHLAAWFLYPPGHAAIAADPALLANVYITSAVTTIGMIAVIVYYALRLANQAQAETDALLHNILPASVVPRLKAAAPGETIADSLDNATVLFADIVSFTPLARQLGAAKTIHLLNTIFTQFDLLASKLKLEKIKTIGDAYMVAGGLPQPSSDHPERLARMALGMLAVMEQISAQNNPRLTLRIGVWSGPVMAGVIGTSRLAYDIWGDTVNMASRMESSGVSGKIHVEESLKSGLETKFHFESRGMIDIRDVGLRKTWFLIGEK